MEIKLEHDEIIQAIEDYLGKQICLNPGQNIEVELTAGRGGKGHYADIKIGNTAETAGAITDSRGKTEKSAVETTSSNDAKTDGSADSTDNGGNQDGSDYGNAEADTESGSGSGGGGLFSD